MDKEEDDEDKDDEKHHDDDHNDDEDDDQVDLDKTSFLTSAIFFYHESQWNWMGSSKKIQRFRFDHKKNILIFKD